LFDKKRTIDKKTAEQIAEKAGLKQGYEIMAIGVNPKKWTK